MTETAKKKLAAIENNRSIAKQARIEKAKNDNKVSAYRNDAKEAVKKAQQEHGYKSIMDADKNLTNAITNAETRITHAGIACVVDVIAELLRANPKAHQETENAINEKFGIEFLQNDHVHEHTFVKCFAQFASRVCETNWLVEHQPCICDDGRLFVQNILPYAWAPCIGVKFDLTKFNPAEPEEFLKWAENELQRLVKNWAARWVDQTASDEQLQQAILAELRLKYGNPENSQT